MGTNPPTNPPTNPASPSEDPDVNVVLVAGRLVHNPETRTLPSGSIALSFSLTVRTPGEKTTSVPAVWYDPPKRAVRWAAGDNVVAHGAVVRRFFRTGAGLGSATEVVVQRAELVRHRQKARLVRERAEGLIV